MYRRRNGKYQTCCEENRLGKLLNAGQTCVAPDYILIHESKKIQFIKHLVESIEEFYGNDPINNRISRIINRKHFRI